MPKLKVKEEKPKREKQKKESSQSQKLRDMERSSSKDRKRFEKKIFSRSNAHTAQETIRYKKMYADGICEVEDGIYSKALRFADINYQIAQESVQDSIFSKLCDFYNAQNSNVWLQLLLINKHIDQAEFRESMLIRDKYEYSKYIAEYNGMLREKALEGNNAITKEKYLIYSVRADDLQDAKMQFARIEGDMLDRFSSMESKAEILNGAERLAIINTFNRPGVKGTFDYGSLVFDNLSTKDYVAPSSFDFSNKSYYEVGDKVAQVLLLRDLPLQMTDNFLKKLLDIPIDLAISIHAHQIEKSEAIKKVGTKVTLMRSQKADETSRARKKGYDEDLIPEEVSIAKDDAEALLLDLKEHDQNLFATTILIWTIADNLEELTTNIFKIMSVCKGDASCSPEMLDYQQEQAINSVYPLGLNRILSARHLPTYSLAIFMPFTAQELFETGGIYYGQNRLSSNLIFFDRRKMSAPNGWILGMPGSGKSFKAKEEMVAVLFGTDDEVLVIDPEREYSAMAKALGGEIIEISPSSNKYINPFDMDLEYSDKDNPLLVKADFIYSFVEMITGEISSPKRSIIDRCLRIIYDEYISSRGKTQVPTLHEFYDVLCAQSEKEAKELALDLEVYIKGSLSVFANRTNVDINNRFTVYDVFDIGQNLKSVGMLTVLDQIWNKIIQNWRAGKRTWVYIDEIQMLFSNPYSSEYFDQLWARARKWQAIPTGITQNVDRLIHNDKARQMLSNSDFILMMKQSSNDASDLRQILSLSEQQMKYFSGAVDEGRGLLYTNAMVIPFSDKFDTHTELYSVMSTKAEERIRVF